MPRNYTPRIPLECLECGAAFLRTTSVVAAGRGKYCSNTCVALARSNRETLPCGTCGRSISRKRSAIKSKIAYCSISCRASAPPALAIVADDGLTARVPLQRRDGTITGYTVVDVEDAGWAQQWRWHATRYGRVVRNEAARLIYLHREIVGLPRVTDGREVDHIDRDTLNNRRGNLRVVTRAQNAQNLPARRDATSGYRGVSWDRIGRRWRAYVSVDGKRHHLGYFHDKEAAATAASEARRRLMPFATD